jgi:hypothetical protein
MYQGLETRLEPLLPSCPRLCPPVAHPRALPHLPVLVWALDASCAPFFVMGWYVATGGAKKKKKKRLKGPETRLGPPVVN